MTTFTQWVKGFISPETYPVHQDWMEVGFDDFFFKSRYEFAIRDIAFWQCVNLVSNALSRSEFKTFLNWEEVQKDEYYRWNYQPNINQCTNCFMKKLIGKLFSENEALVISDKTRQLVVADSWSVDEYVFKENVYYDITVDELTLKKKYKESDVLHFKLNSKSMRPLLNGLYDIYEDIIEYAMQAFVTSRGEKGVLKLPTNYSNNPQAQNFIEKLQGDFANFAEAESALLPLFGDMDYTSITKQIYSSDNSRDSRDLIDDIMQFTARAFGIPPLLLTGNIEGLDSAIEQFLTFCVDPIADMLGEEINRKLYKKRVLKGSYIKIDTTAIKHIDLLSVATSIDKLIASGAYTINEVRERLGSEVIDSEVGDIHWITKNYANIDFVAGGVTEGIDPSTAQQTQNTEEGEANEEVSNDESESEDS